MSDSLSQLPKLVVLLGPTASGKTEWGVRLAKRFNGEIISADSRQVYTKMHIGTAKPKGVWQKQGIARRYMVDGIPHHLVDFLDPGKMFTVAEFRDAAIKHIKKSDRAGRVPILVGGTGQYISSVVDNWMIPRISEHKELRKSLSEKTNDELFDLLQTMDPAGARVIDRHNPRRLIRALEVCILSGEPFSKQQKKGPPIFETLEIGIAVPREMLYRRIEERIRRMMKDGLLAEIKALLKQKYDWHLPSMSGISYRQFRDYLEGNDTLTHAIDLLNRDTRHFARRQMTWFRRDKRIQWVSSYQEAENLVAAFLPHAPE